MKNNLLKNCVLAFAFLFMAVNFAAAQNTANAETKFSGITTLYALDPLAHTFCFGDGREGGVFQQNETRNRCSDIDFNAYNEGGLTVGFEGGRNGAIIDLGSPTDLKQRYGYEETVGNGQGFASLRAANGKIFILKQRRPHTEQELNEAVLLLAGGKTNASAAVKTGHIYLMRLTDSNDKSFERVVKLIVLAYVPGESVTLRWQVM